MARNKKQKPKPKEKPATRHHVKRGIPLAPLPKPFADEDEDDASAPIETFMRSLSEPDRRLMLQLVIRHEMAGKNRGARMVIARQVETLCNTLVREAVR